MTAHAGIRWVLMTVVAISATVARGQEKQLWALERPREVTPPSVKDAAWCANDVDRFALARLEAAGLKPVA